MDAIKNGGPAFAALATTAMGDVHHQPGMSLRDYFAGQALKALVATTSPAEMGISYDKFRERTAISSYEYADAMLAARLTGDQR